jgi:hypothetical protein
MYFCYHNKSCYKHCGRLDQNYYYNDTLCCLAFLAILRIITLIRRLANVLLHHRPHVFIIRLFYLEQKIGFIVSLLYSPSCPAP